MGSQHLSPVHRDPSHALWGCQSQEMSLEGFLPQPSEHIQVSDKICAWETISSCFEIESETLVTRYGRLFKTFYFGGSAQGALVANVAEGDPVKEFVWLLVLYLLKLTCNIIIE